MTNRNTAIEQDQEALDDLALISDAAHAVIRLSRQVYNQDQKREIETIALALVKLRNRAKQRRRRAAEHI